MLSRSIQGKPVGARIGNYLFSTTCPRCGARLRNENDLDGRYLDCLICGYQGYFIVDDITWHEKRQRWE